MNPSGYRIERCTEWSDTFFAELASFRNSLPRSRSHALDETLGDFRQLFSPGAAFARRNDWLAIRCERDGRTAARLIVTRPREQPPGFAPCGWFEAVDDVVATRLMMEEASSWARDRGARSLRAPMQGNFFLGYRIRLPGAGDPFYGEPIYPDFYHAHLRSCGFAECGRWETLRIRTSRALAHFAAGARGLLRRRSGSDLRVRSVDLGRWRDELRLVHRLLTESFSGMKDYMPISFDEFEAQYDSFKYLVHPGLAYFVEKDGVPVGFQIGMFDPLPVLLARQRSRLPARLRDAWTLLRLKLNRRRILVLYVGKLPGAEGVRGVTALLTKRMIRTAIRSLQPQALICYLADSSPVRQLLPKDLERHAEYVLYEKTLQ